MEVKKQQVMVVIPGLTNRGTDEYYSNVSIYRPNINIKNFSKDISGFMIDDFIDTNLFFVYDSTNIRRRVINSDDISPTDTLFVIERLGDSESIFNVDDYYWIHNEVIKVESITMNDDSYFITVSRGEFETSSKWYMGVDNELKENDWNGRNYIETHKNDFNGLIVELYDTDDILTAIGSIKEVTYANGVIVIDCDDYLSVLESTLPTRTQKNKDDEDIDIPFEIKKMLISFFGFEVEDINYNFYEQQSSISKYIDYNDLLFLIENSDIIGSSVYRDRDSSISDYIKLIEFASGAYIVFSQGSYRLLSFFKYESTFNFDITKPSKLLYNDMSNIKYTSTRIFSANKITFEFRNRDLNIYSKNKVSIGSGSISFKIGFDLSDDDYKKVRSLIQIVSKNYFRIMDYAICELKIQTPGELNNTSYAVGETFNIDDISKFYTYEDNKDKTFNTGIVIKNEGENISILVTRPIFFDPISLALPVSGYELSGSDIILNIYQNIAMPYTRENSDKLDHKPPYFDRSYLKDDDIVSVSFMNKLGYLSKATYDSGTTYSIEDVDRLTGSIKLLSKQDSYYRILFRTSLDSTVLKSYLTSVNPRILTYMYRGEIPGSFQENFISLDGSSIWM